jgi:hypothetical protein
MILTLFRFAKKEKYTIGRLFIDNKYFCDALEPPEYFENKKNVPDKTCIPSGIYALKIGVYDTAQNPRDIVELVNAPHRTDILIHAGNKPEDTKGCILLGRNLEPGLVLGSAPYEKDLTAKVKASISSGDKAVIVIM